MTDIIKFNTFEELKEFNDKLNAELGYPKSSIRIGGGIHVDCVTETHTIPIEHPIEKGSYAVELDPEISKILSNEEMTKIESLKEDWYAEKNGFRGFDYVSKEAMIEKTLILEEEKARRPKLVEEEIK